MHQITTLLLSLIISNAAFANFHCYSLRNYELSAIKDKLIAACDLDRPYSMAQSGEITRITTVCCHDKKSEKNDKKEN